MTTQTRTNSELLNDAVVGMTSQQAESLCNYMLGSLSVTTKREVWVHSLSSAKELVERQYGDDH